MAISMLKIRRPLGRLIFNMGIAIPGKTVYLIEMAPRLPTTGKLSLNIYTPFNGSTVEVMNSISSLFVLNETMINMGI